MHAPFCAHMHLRGGGGVGSACGSFAGLAATPSLRPAVGVPVGRVEGGAGVRGSAALLPLPASPAGAPGGDPSSHLSSFSSLRAGSPRGVRQSLQFPVPLPSPQQPRSDAPGAAQLPGPALSLPSISRQLSPSAARQSWRRLAPISSSPPDFFASPTK